MDLLLSVTDFVACFFLLGFMRIKDRGGGGGWPLCGPERTAPGGAGAASSFLLMRSEGTIRRQSQDEVWVTKSPFLQTYLAMEKRTKECMGTTWPRQASESPNKGKSSQIIQCRAREALSKGHVMPVISRSVMYPHCFYTLKIHVSDIFKQRSKSKFILSSSPSRLMIFKAALGAPLDGPCFSPNQSWCIWMEPKCEPSRAPRTEDHWSNNKKPHNVYIYIYMRPHHFPAYCCCTVWESVCVKSAGDYCFIHDWPTLDSKLKSIK